jgi:hypothetical protein
MALKAEIYKEAGVNYRFFLGWRHASAAGYLVILGAVVSLGISAFKDAKELLWLIPLCAAPVGVVLWLVDLRTRDAYHAAVRAGKGLEAPERGFFTVLDEDVVIPRVGERSDQCYLMAARFFFCSWPQYSIGGMVVRGTNSKWNGRASAARRSPQR